MEIDINACLYDILKAIEEIEGYFAGQPMVFENFKQDVKTRRAVERNLEIIGEAVSRIIKKSPEIEISQTKRIISTRNRIIHGYDTVSEDIIWGVIVKYVPVLKEEVKQLLNNHG